MARTALLVCLFLTAAAGLSPPAQATCGDGILDVGESCDDGGILGGDGCSAVCSFEPQCLVAHAAGADPVQVVRVDPDATLSSLGSAAIAGTASSDHKGATRCGRFVYFLRGGGSVEGFEVGAGGALSPISGATSGTPAALACDESRGLLFGFGGSQYDVASFRVDASGDLTAADQTPLSFCPGLAGALHPVSGELFASCQTPGSLSGSGSTWRLEAYSSDDLGNLTAGASDNYFTSELPVVRDLAFTPDAGFLVVPNVKLGTSPIFGNPPENCFAWFPGPIAGPPAEEPQFTCSGVFAGGPGGNTTTYQAFVPRPEAGPLFYYQSAGSLRTGELSESSVTSRFDTTPSHDTQKLLTAFDGQVLLSLGPGEVASYGIASDQVTLSPIQTLPLGGIEPLESGVLLPCPALGDADGDGVDDTADNCVGVANADQADANAGADDDSSLPGVQHYGDACDADLDDDGLVAPSDFFSVFRPCIGQSVAQSPECAVADFDGSGLVAASDFFGVLRPALGSAPGPGVTE